MNKREVIKLMGGAAGPILSAFRIRDRQGRPESTIRGKRSVKSLPGRLAVRRSTISPLWLIAHIQGRCFGAESDRKMRPTMTPLWSRHRERRRKSVGHGLAIKPDD
jgi:hypothetical protein